MSNVAKRILAGLVVVLWTGMALAQGQYQVQAGDALNIEVLEDASLNRSVIVLPDGRFSFPFAGSLQARGLTVSQIQSSVTDAIASNFAAAPTVFVSVAPAQRAPVRSGSVPLNTDIKIYFVGEVNNPGILEVEAGTTLLQALAAGGGVSRFAATKRIQLRRADATGTQQVSTFNYKALTNGAAMRDIELKDGDVILVPERRLFE